MMNIRDDSKANQQEDLDEDEFKANLHEVDEDELKANQQEEMDEENNEDELKANLQEEPVTVSPFSHIPSHLLPPLYEVKYHRSYSISICIGISISMKYLT